MGTTTLVDDADKKTILKRLAQVTGHRITERLRPPRPERAIDVPFRSEAINPRWLTEVLCADRPGLRVIEVSFGGTSNGTTNRRAVEVRYNDPAAALAAGLPRHLHSKCSHTLVSRLTVGLAGILPGEPGFYTKVRSELEIEAPRAWFADYDPRTWRSCILLDDVAVAKNATFCTPFTEINLPMAEGIVDLLATLHGTYWNSPRLDSEFTWLRGVEQYQQHIAAFICMRDQVQVGFDRARAVLPETLIVQRDRLWPAYQQALRLADAGTPTFLHGDGHIANYYRTDTGTMGLCDWQVSIKGLWGYDYCYSLTSALSVDNRRAWEEQLLHRYLDQLEKAGGPRLEWDDAWLVYRQQIMYGFHAWLWTIGRSRLQPQMHPPANCRALLQRMSHAVTDLNSIEALGC